MPSCYVLDVGHGNSAVVVGDAHVAIVDGGSGAALGEFLERMGFQDIETVLVSHADADHISGVAALLSMCLDRKEMRIGSVYMNPDPRATAIFEDLLHVLQKLDKERGVNWVTSVGVDSPGTIDLGGCEVTAIAPSKFFRTKGIGGKMAGAAKSSANSLSAVIRVTLAGEPWILLPGDLDFIGFNALIEDEAVATAEVVVFPHHGGQGGTADQTEKLVTGLCDVCKLSSLIFSARSEDPRFPSLAVLQAVYRVDPVPHIYSIGSAQHLSDPTDFDLRTVRNGTGTLHVSARDAEGKLTIGSFSGAH
jgi:competence protein ComEC